MAIRKEVKIGIYATLVIAVTFCLIEFLKGKDILSKWNTYYVTYPEVEGVVQSTAITIAGFEAGKVTDIKYNGGQKGFTVELSVSNNFEIPSDTYAEIYSSDLLGTKKIRLILGESMNMAQDGNFLNGGHETDILAKVTNALMPTKNRIDSLLSDLDKTVTSVHSILNSDFQTDLNKIIRDISRTSGHLQRLMSSLESKSPEIENIVSNIDSISASLKESSKPLKGTIESAQSTLESIQELIAMIGNPDGSLGKLTTSDSLYNSINSLTNDLDSLVKRIEKDPKKYIKISVF